MRLHVKLVVISVLAALLLVSTMVFTLGASAQDRQPEKSLSASSRYLNNPEARSADGGRNARRLDSPWTAWYKDPHPKYGPEWHASTVDQDGNVIAVGTSADQVTSPVTGDLIMGKFDKDGQMLPGWPKHRSETGFRFNEGQKVVVDAGGNITVAGYTISDATPRVWYFTVWRFDSNGDLLTGWPKFTDNNQAYGTGVILDSNGDIVCCGGNVITGVMIVVKYKPDGSLVAGWPKTYQFAPGQPTFGYGLIQDSDQNYVVAGYTAQPAPSTKAVLYKLDVNGHVLTGWPKQWDSGVGINDEYFSVSQDTNGDYCLVGRCQGTTANDGKLVVTRYSKDGNQLSGWPKVYAQAGYRDNWVDVWRGSVDPSGNIAAAVTCDAGDSVHTVEYARDGSMVHGFPKVFTRAGYDGETRSCDVDDQGNVFTVGYSRSKNNPTDDYRTFVIKYAPECVWYLAEGSTGTNDQGSFETWILVQNPGDDTASVQLYYQTPKGEVEGQKITLAPHTRETRNVADKVPNEFSVSTKVVSDNPVIAERAMYWNSASGVYRQAATDSIGVTNPAKTWYLAEGSTGANEHGSFETWILVQNPGDDTAKVQLFYQTPSGEVAGHKIELKPHTRETRSVADFVPNEFSVSTKVVSDKPVIAERATYWQNPGVYRESATDSIGAADLAKTWYLAEGSTGSNDRGSFETWVLVQNPGADTAKVQLYYQTPTGEVKGHQITLKPHTRETRSVADFVPNEFSVSTKVVSDKPVIAERAMYWHSAEGVYRQAATGSIGVTASAASWYLAEGSTGSNDRGSFETWVLVQNPGDETANVQLYYQTPTGEVKGHQITLKPHTRETRSVADFVPNEFSVSTKVVSDKPVIAERAMYWNSAQGVYRQAAHDSIGSDPP